jgi:hypothetical protein
VRSFINIQNWLIFNVLLDLLIRGLKALAGIVDYLSQETNLD